VLTAVVPLVAGAVALASLDPDDYRVRSKEVTLPADEEVNAKLRCPKGHRVGPSGALIYEPGLPPDPALALNSAVPSSAPSKRGKVWHFGATNGPGEERRMSLVAACAPNRQLRGFTVEQQPFVVGSGMTGGGRVSCPGGSRVFSGGAVWHEPGEQPAADLSDSVRTSSSIPARRARGWYADGYNFSGFELRLKVVALCARHRALEGLKRKVKEVPSAAYSTGFGGSVECPRGTRVVTGGGGWHPEGEPPDPEGAAGTLISSSAPTRNFKRWYATGVNFIGPADYRLQVVALCVPG
jgi:hypothetical protein